MIPTSALTKGLRSSNGVCRTPLLRLAKPSTSPGARALGSDEKINDLVASARLTEWPTLALQCGGTATRRVLDLRWPRHTPRRGGLATLGASAAPPRRRARIPQDRPSTQAG